MVSPAVENRRKWFPGRLHPVAIMGSPGPQISSGNLSSFIERQCACVRRPQGSGRISTKPPGTTSTTNL